MGDDSRSGWRSLLWRTWESFGVSSWERGAPESVVDPEALVLATVAFDDLRLRGESIDWAAEHQHLLHGRRLRTLARGTGLEGRVADWLTSVADGSNRSGKSTRREDALGTKPATAALRLRALTGTTARSEIVRALHGVLSGAVPPMSASDLVSTLGLTRAHVNRALADLVAARLVEAIGTVKRQRYVPIEHDPLASSLWAPWRSYGFAPWFIATRVATSLLAARDLVDAATVAAVSDAVDIYESNASLLELITGSAHPRHEPGPAGLVGPQLARILDESVAEIIAALDAPVRDQRTEVRRPESSPWAGGTWIVRGVE